MLLQVDVPNSKIMDQFCTAIETTVGEWLASAQYLGPKVNDHWYSHPELLDLDTFAVEFKYDDPDHNEGTFKGKKTIKYADIQTGLQKMALASPAQFAELMNENGDAWTADSFLQFIIFGELIYG